MDCLHDSVRLCWPVIPCPLVIGDLSESLSMVTTWTCFRTYHRLCLGRSSRRATSSRTVAMIMRARDLGMTRMLAQGFLLANRMLDTPLPTQLSAEMRQDRTVQSLAHIATQSLVQDERYWSTDNTPVSFMPAQARYRLKLRKNLRYKWNNVYFHSLWTDGCRRIRLPERLFPLYYLLALFTWPLSILRRYLPASHSH